MVAIAIVAAAGWVAPYLGFAAVTSDRRLRRGIRRFRLDGGPPDLGDPALVNLVTTGCKLDGAAFAGYWHSASRSRGGCGARRPWKGPATWTSPPTSGWYSTTRPLSSRRPGVRRSGRSPTCASPT
jgi:hypothetical protein